MAAQVLEPIECSVQPLDVAFHPTKNILAAGLVDGTIELHDFTSRLTRPSLFGHNKGKTNENDDDEDEDDTILSSIEVHCKDQPKYKLKSDDDGSSNSLSSSCKTLIFSHDGRYLYTAGNGGSIACLDVEKASSYRTSDSSLLWKIDGASPHGINTLYQIIETSPSGPLLVSGDDEGVIRIWDPSILFEKSKKDDHRNPFDGLLDLPKGCVATFHQNKDYITGFGTDEKGNLLLASSADGTLTVIDTSKVPINNQRNDDKRPKEKKPKQIEHPPIKSGQFYLIRQSDEQEDELLSLCVIKGGKKVVCGTQNGVLNIWSFGTWGDISDRYPGHPQSIDSILKVDDDTILTGSSDGVVRIVQIQPDRLLGILGDHDGFPVEKLKFSSERKVVGSVSHDMFIRLWDASIFANDGIDEDAKDDSSMEDIEETNEDSRKTESKAVASKKKHGESDDEWEDMDEESDENDSMDDDSDDSDSDDDFAGKGKMKKFKTENEQFFEDL